MDRKIYPHMGDHVVCDVNNSLFEGEVTMVTTIGANVKNDKGTVFVKHSNILQCSSNYVRNSVFYTKLLAKLYRLKDKTLNLDDYIKEVEGKVNRFKEVTDGEV